LNTQKEKHIVLHPGDFYFGDDQNEVHTLLGSCISITLWHPTRKIGGICHFVLPYNPQKSGLALNGRYADDCMKLFKSAARQCGTRITEYQAKIFGGGNVSPHTPQTLKASNYGSVGDRNAAAALDLLMHENVPVLVVHVGEFGYRKIIFDIQTGSVWVKFTSMQKHTSEKSLTGRS